MEENQLYIAAAAAAVLSSVLLVLILRRETVPSISVSQAEGKSKAL